MKPYYSLAERDLFGTETGRYIVAVKAGEIVLGNREQRAKFVSRSRAISYKKRHHIPLLRYKLIRL